MYQITIASAVKLFLFDICK